MHNITFLDSARRGLCFYQGGQHRPDANSSLRREGLKELNKVKIEKFSFFQKVRDWVGLRPFRPSVRLEREMLGVQSVVHNYGHGGSGITVFQVKLEIM